MEAQKCWFIYLYFYKKLGINYFICNFDKPGLPTETVRLPPSFPLQLLSLTSTVNTFAPNPKIQHKAEFNFIIESEP